jgi:hypothetical protein
MFLDDVLARFKDRERELALFQRMLKGETDKRILCILDHREKGKTWLIWRLFHDCKESGVPVVLLDFHRDRSGLSGDFGSVASEVRGYLGDKRTPNICNCMARMSLLSALSDMAAGGESPGVDFGQDNIFAGADVRTVAGGNILQVGAIFTGRLTPEQMAQRRAEMGRALGRDLEALGRIVLLIDTFEQAPDDTRAWLERWVFRSLCHELPHALLVVAGRPKECQPFFTQARLWSDLITAIDCLDPFSDDEILAYYESFGFTVTAVEVSLLTIARTSPGLMAQLGDLLKETQGGMQ